MAPTRFGQLQNPKPMAERMTLAKRKAEADRVYYRELEEIAFKVQLGLLGNDLLDTPPPDLLLHEPATEPRKRIYTMKRIFEDEFGTYPEPSFPVTEEWLQSVRQPTAAEMEWDGSVTEVEDEDGVDGYFLSSKFTLPKWIWGAEFIVKPNNGWGEIIEIN